MKSGAAGILMLLLLILLGQAAWAGSGAGHTIILAEASRQLPPELRAKVTEILKNHPNYSKWESSFQGNGGGKELGTFIFMRASTWPDEIRRGGGADTKYDHPHWHYVNWPLHPPGLEIGSEPSPDDDVLFGIGQYEMSLSVSSAGRELKAVYLVYFIRLMGDTHQSLHRVSIFTDAYPKGAKVGNHFYISPARRGIKLHSFSDGLLGAGIHSTTQLNEAGFGTRSIPSPPFSIHWGFARPDQ